MQTIDDFSTFTLPAPDLDALRREYADLNVALDGASTSRARLAVIARWDEIRRRFDSWEQLTMVRFEQDTANPAHKRARDLRNELAPKLTALDVEIKRKLLAAPDRPALERKLGRQAFALWAADVAAFEPAIQADLTREAALANEYTELVASAKLEFDGKTVNLAGIQPYTESPDRDVRYRAQQTRWSFFSQNRVQLDRIFDDLVKLRHGMARKLGLPSFVPLGYQRMHRVDYDASDVERFRAEVVREVVPLAQAIMAARAKALGLEKLMFWDEPVTNRSGNVLPRGDRAWIVASARAAFAAMNGTLGDFFKMLVDRGLLDLENRPGKAGGGFCTSFPTHGVPFIFANFNGTAHDVEVLIHEMGHAFQNWSSRRAKLLDYLWPTSESAEIDSMGMEFLSHPQLERFFDGDAARFRLEHIADQIERLPYMVAVDHFQHLVYATPDASPAQRNDMWRTLEARYMPWRDYGDLEYPAQGGRWQAQLHIYQIPFYYIDYALAACCALQFWARSQDDYAGALADYVRLCARGGEAPFQELVRSANLKSPFAPGVLSDVTRRARVAIGV